VSRLTLAPGDLLALITDGFTEVFDSREQEMGMEDFKSALATCAEKALPDIYRELRARTLKFGKQTDDQTMLLIRLGVPARMQSYTNRASAPSPSGSPA
jgi:serine phosphatase RsbU (regulator of sigma subunit)